MVNQNERTYDITRFTIRETTQCGKEIRSINSGASSMEEVAGRIVRFLYDTMVDGQTGLRACSLVRFFKTHVYAQLDPGLKIFAANSMGGEPADPAMRCLTLLGTVGENQEWNSPKASKGHQAIPLPSEKAVEAIPMMKNLIKQLGMNVSHVVKPDPALLMDMEQRTYNVFLVPEAPGSPFIPAQEGFVVPYGIKSVLGFGGMLPSGDMFVTIMFMKVVISKEIADLFKTLSLNLKLAILPFDNAVFAGAEKAG